MMPTLIKQFADDALMLTAMKNGPCADCGKPGPNARFDFCADCWTKRVEDVRVQRARRVNEAKPAIAIHTQTIPEERSNG